MTTCNIHEYTNKYTGEAVMPYCLEHDSDADFGADKCYYQKGYEKGLSDSKKHIGSMSREAQNGSWQPVSDKYAAIGVANSLKDKSLEELLTMDLSDPLVIEAIASKKMPPQPVTFIEKLEESRK